MVMTDFMIDTMDETHQLLNLPGAVAQVSSLDAEGAGTLGARPVTLTPVEVCRGGATEQTPTMQEQSC